MRVHDKGPRKVRGSEWWHYCCDVCGDYFWGPAQPHARTHSCAGCASNPSFGVGNPYLRTPEAEREYHGGQFNRGEW